MKIIYAIISVVLIAYIWHLSDSALVAFLFAVLCGTGYCMKWLFTREVDNE